MKTLCLSTLGRPLPSSPLRNGAVLSCGADKRGAAGTVPGAAEGRRIPAPVPPASGPEVAATAVERCGARRSWRCRNSTAASGATRCRNRWPGPRPRSCSSRSAIWICRYWRLSSCPGASGVTANAPAKEVDAEHASARQNAQLRRTPDSANPRCRAGQRDRVLTGVKARRCATPPLRGAAALTPAPRTVPGNLARQPENHSSRKEELTD